MVRTEGETSPPLSNQRVMGRELTSPRCLPQLRMVGRSTETDFEIQFKPAIWLSREREREVSSLPYPATDGHNDDARWLHGILRRQKYSTMVPTTLIVSTRRAPDCEVPLKQVLLRTGRTGIMDPRHATRLITDLKRLCVVEWRGVSQLYCLAHETTDS